MPKAGSKIYSTLDSRSGYYHKALYKELQKKSAIVTPTGNFKFWNVPFGFVQAPAYFQMSINAVLSGLNFVFRYLDDILIYSPDPETHVRHLEVVFQCLVASV